MKRQERLRMCSHCQQEGLDRRRASEHKAKCWKQSENAHWYFQDAKTKAYWMRAQQVPGNNYNRKHGTISMKAGIHVQN